jgi:hypothetical protein
VLSNIASFLGIFLDKKTALRGNKLKRIYGALCLFFINIPKHVGAIIQIVKNNASLCSG